MAVFEMSPTLHTITYTPGELWVPKAGEKVVIDRRQGVHRVWQREEVDGMEVAYRWPRVGADTTYAELAARVAKHYKRKAWWH